MKKELDSKLFKEFPWTSHVPGSSMDFGFAFRDGWFNLVYKLCVDIQKELDKEKDKRFVKQFRLFQAKEKFGGLRFYIGYGNTKIFKLIQVAENDSYEICEVCGKKGKLRNLTWMQTLCVQHFKEVKKKVADWSQGRITEK